jgi:uncharacterized protein YbjT (DUF2867 family)
MHSIMPKQKSSTIVITGASGFVGSALVKHFAELDWKVRALVRDPKKFKNTKNVSYIAYDMGDPVPDEAFKGANYLVHTAYVKEDRKNPDAYHTNHEGTRLLLEASRANKLSKNIFMSSMSAQHDAVSTYGKQKFDIEKMFDSKQDIVIRSGLIVGNAGLLNEIAQFIKTKHVAPLIDGGHQPLQTIAIYDLVTVIDTMFKQDVHGTFTIAEPTPITYRDLYKLIGKKLQTPVVLVPVPFWMPLLAIRTINMLHLPFKITEDNLQGLKKLRAEDTTEDLAKLGVSLDPIEVVLARNDILANQ